MDTEVLLSHLSAKTVLSDGFSQALNGLVQVELYKSRQILHAAGQQENRLYFLQKGICRNYYYDQAGNEHTVKFWERGSVIFSYQGYYHVPGYYYTEIIEDTEAITLSYKSLRDLSTRYDEIQSLIGSYLLDDQEYEHIRQQLLLLPASERYRKFLVSNPVLFQKSPLKFVASYLGMTRETLTRMIGRR